MGVGDQEKQQQASDSDHYRPLVEWQVNLVEPPVRVQVPRECWPMHQRTQRDADPSRYARLP